MTFNVIYGRSGVGKTRLILEKAAAAQEQGKKVIYLVPEQFSLQSEKALLAATNGRGLFNAQVLSFRRMAYLVFAEMGLAGLYNKKNLDDASKNMLLRKILSELKDNLLFFKGSVDKAGFIDSLAQLVSECYHYAVKAEDLKNAAEADNGRLRMKLLDLCLVIQYYKQYLEENYISTDEVLDLMAEKIAASETISNADVFIDGFKSFTPQEFTVIEQIFSAVDSVTIALTMDDYQRHYHMLGMDDFFHETKRTTQKLNDIADSNDALFCEAVYLGKAARHVDRADLGFLAEHYFRDNVIPYQGVSDNAVFVKAESQFEEIRYTAEQIIELIKGGYEYNDIAVVVCGLEEYAKNVKALFSLYEIPSFIDETTDILSHPFVEYILAALDVIAYEWQYESVFRLLKTDMTHISRSEVDLLENYVIAYGVNRGKWKKRWEFGFSGSYERFDADVINSLREAVVELFSPLSARFTKGGKYKVEDLTRALYGFICSQGAKSSLERTIHEAQDAGRLRDYAENSRIWGKVMGVLDKAVEILGEEVMTVASFSKIIKAGFSGVGMELAPLALDVCVVGDLRRTRLPDVKALFILGANEGLLPAKPSTDGIFTDSDRQSLMDSGLHMSPFGLSKILDERISVYNAISRPSHYLSVSCYLSDSGGKAASPSPVFDTLCAMLPRAKRVTALKKEGFIENLTPSFYRNDMNGKICRIETALNSNAPQTLSRETLRTIYPGIVKASVSRLERFAQCPFSYFAEYNLSLKERRVYEVQSVDLGNIFHDVLDRFSTRLTQEDIDWSSAAPEQIYALTEQSVDDTFDNAENEIFKTSSQYQNYARRIKAISHKSVWALTEHLKRGAFSLAFTEAAFTDRKPGDDDGLYLGTIKLPLDDGKYLVLEGRIDRVDVVDDEHGRLIKIIDYKSGGKSFNFAEFHYGLQLQLMLYMDAFLKKYGEISKHNIDPSAVFYFKIANPFTDYGKGEDDILKQFKMTGVVSNDERSVKAIDASSEKGTDIYNYRSAPVSPEGFVKLLEHSVKKAEQLGNDIIKGNVAVAPFKFKSRTGCDFCNYRPVCKHEPNGLAGYRVLQNIKNDDMRDELLGETFNQALTNPTL